MYERKSVCKCICTSVCRCTYPCVCKLEGIGWLALSLFTLFSQDSFLTDSGASLAFCKALQSSCLWPSQWWPRLAYMWVWGGALTSCPHVFPVTILVFWSVSPGPTQHFNLLYGKIDITRPNRKSSFIKGLFISLFLKRKKKYVCMCVCTWVCAHTHWGQKRVSGTLELKVWAFVSYAKRFMGLGLLSLKEQ